jgi:hypothetical protein
VKKSGETYFAISFLSIVAVVLLGGAAAGTLIHPAGKVLDSIKEGMIESNGTGTKEDFGRR